MRHLNNYLYMTIIASIFSSTLQAAPIIKVCDDEGGWPPYTYPDLKDTSKTTGAATDLTREILKRAGYEAEITLMPWKRCLLEVESGAKFSLLMNASYNEERGKKFLFSKPLYTLNGRLFYLVSQFPERPHLASIEEMKKYRYCGILGYNYDMYHLPDNKLDNSAKDEKGMIKKLRAGHCDFILGQIEIFKGYAVMGLIDLKGIDSIRTTPDVKPIDYFMLISRGPKGGVAFQEKINKALDSVKSDGTYERILNDYGI